ncbi:emerin-like [Engraulis encrasicolus]|uniref:emerin-like n=1 Tax=Engraulis encrasicolus TaxID=184585 RepID=UPI002FD701B2
MSMLSNKTDDEIMWLLDDYGIKHGPVVGTTRHLYEKKLRDAITKAKKTRVKKGRPPIDMSMYRDEGEEEVTYEPRRPQIREEDFRERQSWAFAERDFVDDYRTQATFRGTAQSAPPPSRWGTAPPPAEEEEEVVVEEKKTSTPWVPLWVKFLVFLVVVGVLVLVFLNMEPEESEPAKRLT